MFYNVLSQAGNATFNRAKLLNVGFKEAMKHYDRYDCVMLHDVDLLPENEQLIYTFADQPKHMSAAINIYNYKP